MKNRRNIIFFILPAAILIFAILNISLGSVRIPFENILEVLFTGDTAKTSWTNIILNFRLPKVFTAILVGAGLSVSGLLMQTLFRNPLAGPFVLGISSGASLGVALLLLAGIGTGTTFLYSGFADWLVVVAASIGSSLVLVLVMAMASRVRDSMTLLIIGLMLGSLTGAVVSILQYFSTGEEIQVYLFWTFGSLGGLDWNELAILAILVMLGLLGSITILRPLNSLLLSENYARSMGINLAQTRYMIIGITSLLAGTITAFCGPIAFIGLAIPHMCRMLFSSADHKILIPASMLIGGLSMLICDIISQLPGSESVLPINAITSLLGAPVVIWIVISHRSVKHSF